MRQKKDAAYMRKAYLYSGILFVVALIGSLILSWRIVKQEEFEAQRAAEAAQEVAEEAEETSRRR